MKVLFTGASSFTGFWFVARLATQGVEVTAPLRGEPEAYEGVRAERVHLLSRTCELIPDCPFGGETFLDLVRSRDFDVLCHHAAEVRDYRSPDFDVAGALAANTRNLREVMTLMRERGLKAVVATGSVFEADEGAGPAPRRAFSPYGLSKALTWQTLKFWGETLGAPMFKFVVANPFGPFEEPRFVNHAVERWAKGEALEVRTPRYLRDNIHVDLLSLAYADFVTQAVAGGAGRTFGPCGYMETQGAFAERLGRELAPRLGFAGRVKLAEQTDFSEPLARVNRDVIDTSRYRWQETQAWDALAEHYRARGKGGAPRPPPPGEIEIRGAVDLFDRESVRGWLASAPASPPRHLKVVIDGVERASLLADQFRPDLKRLEVSDGFSGFRYDFGGVTPYAEVVVRLEDRETGAPLPGGVDLKLPALVGGPDSPFFRELEAPLVNIADVSYEPDRIDLRVTCLGSPEQFETPSSPAADIEVVNVRRLRHAYFDALGLIATDFQLHVRGVASDSTLPVAFAKAGPDAFLCSVTIPGSMSELFASIGRDKFARVVGPTGSASYFVASGHDTAARLDGLIARHFGRGMESYERVLDWGAGPGRVAAPLKRAIAPALRVTAVDVDGVNVEVGRAHFPDIEFFEAPFLPPLPFPDASFDAIFGISVVTHLTESAQFAWLKELRRLARPGAPVILTTHSEFQLHRTGESEPRISAQTLKHGFSDGILDENLGKLLAEKNYYRSTFHTHKYVMENWGEYFEVLKIYPNANRMLQDFVVMRAR